MDITLTEAQQKASDKVVQDIIEVRNGDVFSEHSWLSLKGPAGCGKTTTSKDIIKRLLKENFKIAVVAPTHQAAKVIKQTVGINHINLKFASLHSFLGLKPGEINPDTGERKFIRNKKKFLSEIAREEFDVCILDESSMVSKELFGFLKKEMHQNMR